MTLTAGQALRFSILRKLPKLKTYTKMSKSQTFRISVTPTRAPRKRKPTSSHRESAQSFANQLLELLHSNHLSDLQTPDLFVSVISSAVQDLNRVK